MNRAGKTTESRGEATNKSDSRATKLVKFAEERTELLFHDQNGDPWARLRVRDHYEHHRLESKAFRSWLSRVVWEEEELAPSQETLRSALAVLGAKARYDGPSHTLNTRLTWHDGSIWLDLADEKWRALSIGAKEWKIIDNPSILFLRFPHQRPIEVGAKRDRLDLREWLNLKREEDQLLAVIWLITSFIPSIPHPVLVLHGPQGSGKTTLAKMLKAIVDPQEAEVVSIPKDVAELAQVLAHHHLCAFDNLSGLSGWVSDAICRAVSGDGFSKRKLFTDSEDIVFKYQRCVILNGINLVATRPDLLDRSLILELKRLEDTRTEEELWDGFSRCLPEIRAAIFSIISEAVVLKSRVHLRGLPRMADFAQWGFAVAEAMGVGGNRFLQAYLQNTNQQHEVVVDASPVATAVVDFMTRREEWEGSPGKLLEELREIAVILGINTNIRGWPSQPNSLTRQLNTLKLTLEGVGIRFDSGRTSQGRWIRLFRKDGEIPSQSSQSDPSHEQSNDFGSLVDDGCNDDVAVEPSPLNHASSLKYDDDDGDDGNFNIAPKTEVPAQMELFREKDEAVVDMRGVEIRDVN